MELIDSQWKNLLMFPEIKDSAFFFFFLSSQGSPWLRGNFRDTSIFARFCFWNPESFGKLQRSWNLWDQLNLDKAQYLERHRESCVLCFLRGTNYFKCKMYGKC